MIREFLSPTESDQDDLEVPMVYVDLSEIPLDPEEEDGDDALLAATGGSYLPEAEEVERLARRPPKRRKYRIVPFVRELKRGKAGKDVAALQRALKARGIRKGRATGLYGPGTVRDVKRLQRAGNLPQSGVYGRRTHGKLARWYDDYGVYLLHQAKVGSRKQQAQQRLRGAAIYTVNRAHLISYTQGYRRMDGVNRRLRLPQFPRYMDCSAGVTWLFYDAGLPDPNGFGYNGLGYTGTLGTHGSSVSAGYQIGDLHFYGYGHPWSHVTMDLGNGYSWSMGSESGPHIRRSGYRPIRLTKRFDLTKRR